MAGIRPSAMIMAKPGAITLARLEKGWSGRELTRRCGQLQYPTVWHAERGYPVSPNTARIIADAFQMRSTDLFETVPRLEAEQRIFEINCERKEGREE